MESAPSFEHVARFSRGDLRRRVMRRLLVGMITHEDRVGPIREQDDGSEQPAPVEGAEIGSEPQGPAGGRPRKFECYKTSTVTPNRAGISASLD
jgi:hypothetical protein